MSCHGNLTKRPTTLFGKLKKNLRNNGNLAQIPAFLVLNPAFLWEIFGEAPFSWPKLPSNQPPWGNFLGRSSLTNPF